MNDRNEWNEMMLVEQAKRMTTDQTASSTFTLGMVDVEGCPWCLNRHAGLPVPKVTVN